MAAHSSASWENAGLASLLHSPFLIPSLIFHTAIFILLLQAGEFRSTQLENPPIAVNLLEFDGRGKDKLSVGPAKGVGGPRELPKKGTPAPPVKQTGVKSHTAVEQSTPSLPPKPVTPPAPAPAPVTLPGPKAIGIQRPADVVNSAETSPDSLVQLPTKAAPTRLPGGVAVESPVDARQSTIDKALAAGPGIKALHEGVQVPGALRGSGANLGAYGVPGGSPTGSGITGGGTGSGVGGGGTTGLRGNADYSAYLNQLKQRVQSVWKYPDNVSGIQKVAVRFRLDKAGKLLQADVLDSTDSRLNASAVDAMKRASPFPPIPESLKDLANEFMVIHFNVSIRVRG